MTIEQLFNRIDDGIAALEDLATAATRIANELVYWHDQKTKADGEDDDELPRRR